MLRAGQPCNTNDELHGIAQRSSCHCLDLRKIAYAFKHVCTWPTTMLTFSEWAISCGPKAPELAHQTAPKDPKIPMNGRETPREAARTGRTKRNEPGGARCSQREPRGSQRKPRGAREGQGTSGGGRRSHEEPRGALLLTTDYFLLTTSTSTSTSTSFSTRATQNSLSALAWNLADNA